jgi:hypothetical protein
MSSTGMTIEQITLVKDEAYETFDAYCAAMAKSTYAGETEFWLLAEELGITIAIFCRKDEEELGLEHLITYGDQEKGGLPQVCLFWQRGIMSENGNHYDCLLMA